MSLKHRQEPSLLPIGRSATLFGQFEERSSRVSPFSSQLVSLAKDQSAAQILFRRHLIQTFELNNRHLFLVFNGGLDFGICRFRF
jgi:hypothetical protein